MTTYQSLVEAVAIQDDYLLATQGDDPAQSTFMTGSDPEFTKATVYIATDSFASDMGYAPTVSIVVASRAARSQ